MESQSIGIIGVGKMGGGIARTLARETNCEVLVYDKNSAAVAACTAVGARAAESIAEVASAGVVISSLPLPEHVLAVWQELAPQLRPGNHCHGCFNNRSSYRCGAGEFVSGRRVLICGLFVGKGTSAG